jgi:hypothetical protein
MITKTQIIYTLNLLPEKLTIGQLIEHLIFIEKVQNGLDDSNSGKVNSKEETKKKLIKWLR